MSATNTDVNIGFPLVSLGRLVRFGNGSDYKDIEVSDGGYPVYGSGGAFRRASRYLYEGESVLLGRKGTIDRPLYVSGRFWTVDTMYYTVPSPRIVPKFLYYAATTIPFEYYATNTAVPSMTQADLAGHRIPLPPLDEQRAIADYLDQETAQIDALVAKQEEFIGLLRERRSAIVTDALRGLETIKLRRLVRPDRPMSYGILQAGEHVPDGVPYLGPSDLPGEGAFPRLAALRRTHANIAAAYERSRLLGGDVVVSIGPAYGRVAVIPEELEGANLTQDTVRVALDDQFVDTRFIVLALGSNAVATFWDTQIQGATFRRLNLGTLATTPIPFGPLPEQRRLAAQIDEQTVGVDALIAKAEEHIALAKERRSALITAAVTGQFDVRTAKKGALV